MRRQGSCPSPIELGFSHAVPPASTRRIRPLRRHRGLPPRDRTCAGRGALNGGTALPLRASSIGNLPTTRTRARVGRGSTALESEYRKVTRRKVTARDEAATRGVAAAARLERNADDQGVGAVSSCSSRPSTARAFLAECGNLGSALVRLGFPPMNKLPPDKVHLYKDYAATHSSRTAMSENEPQEIRLPPSSPNSRKNRSRIPRHCWQTANGTSMQPKRPPASRLLAKLRNHVELHKKSRVENAAFL